VSDGTRLAITIDTPHGPEVVRPPGGPVTLALAFSGMRCIFVYLVLPGLAPVLGPLVAIALPLVLALYALSMWAAVRAVRRCVSSGRTLAAVGASLLVVFNVASLLLVVGLRA
jgi:hypothetical protein